MIHYINIKYLFAVKKGLHSFYFSAILNLNWQLAMNCLLSKQLWNLINNQTNYVLTSSTRTLHVHYQVTNHWSLDPREPFLCHRPYLVVCKLFFEHFYLENRLNCEHFEIHKSPRAHKVTHDCGFGSSAVCDSVVVRSRPSSFRTACGEQKEWTKKWFARLNWSAW